jgi:hypothetical protein
MGDGNVKLLMFSDIEGCQASPGNQSKFLCSDEFYNEISKRLNEDPKLEVAFLGDYFDQGMRVYNSIMGMTRLLDNFNKDGIERVHVILGNRDVNKLRFFYELNLSDMYLPDGQRWKTWDKYYDGLKGKIGVDLVKHTLSTSMGASQEENKKMTGLYSFMPYDMIKDATDEQALKYLKVALGIIPSDDTTKGALDVLGFFKECKLAHVFNGKVLLAHGGGFDSDAFIDDNYIEGFRSKLSPKYSKTLEAFRKRLSGNDTTDLSSRLTESVTVQNSVDAYNKLLKTVLSQLDIEKTKTEIERLPSWEFILLQALGLKPDPDKEDARYKSLIQSCSQDGCKGPNTPLLTDKDGKKLAKILTDSGITHVSYGHKPICFPIPVIYKRKEIPGVTFISNDTSNGNRKVDEIGENTAIGTMVIFDPNGVQSKIEPVQLNNPDQDPNMYEKNVGMYSAMYDPLTFKTTPFYEVEDGANVLKYGDSKVVFNTKGYDQLKFIAPASNTVTQSDSVALPASGALPTPGGRRRSRNRKYNTKKRGSKRLSKRTKRNKHHTKRSRKHRKY